MFVTNQQSVTEASGGHQTGPTNFALNQRISDERGGVHNGRSDVARGDSGLR